MIVEKTGYKLSDVNSKSRNNFIHSIRPEVIIDREFKKTMTAKGGNSKGNGNVAKQIKGLMSRTIAEHDCILTFSTFNLPSVAERLREMTKFCIVWRTRTTTAKF